jgi:uncharacterized protein
MNKVVIFLITVYQKALPQRHPSCRFIPSCSVYAQEAFTKHSFFKAFHVSVFRIVRCNPWNSGGYDPLL